MRYPSNQLANVDTQQSKEPSLTHILQQPILELRQGVGILGFQERELKLVEVFQQIHIEFEFAIDKL
ncbi:hypothetical protein [Crocosphaera chwakensis]|uniref:Uncharacterized protein n=1 Tax=Crocosphaera chwakensis CCY0110 TaxID=391612 RepID=A3ISK6_9CHRO|nr:hypothetical protein [Crocosphaera chwakensis]EAZ90576.1 hypothetical protein CY0110_20303 [Crocosphaera chwakensis CCY0110]